ncbi:hypothetical protein HU200_022393 [Digitaria exilis]|uniref:non-specific serine/threonine protein kinase n=1 Tax=Digitaria exilis TaxID=1010633 RepID=A0A835EVD1_9POAL|nr:hypothetical protein HU200_022393 [Digitaria exilis]
MLTNGNGSIQMMGHALHPSPLPFHNAQYEDLSASGLAFVVAADRSVLSTAMPGEFLGLLNGSDDGNRSTHVFAVELDTLFNADLGDMNSNHVGVDVDSLVSTAAESAGYYDDATGVFRNLTLISRKAMQVWVDYDAGATLVTVTMAPLGLPRPKKPLLQTTVDPSDVIDDPMYVGFSSGTGVIPTRHCVLGWSFSMDGPAPPLDLSKLPVLPRVGPKKPRSKVLLDVVLPALSTALLIAAVLAVVFFVVQRRRWYAELREDWEDEFGPHRFSYKDLFHATDGFKDRNLLGAGGFGRVYKGVLHPQQQVVAVKRVSHDSRQGVREFVAEVVSIGRLRHRNLVQLLGYCRRKDELLLVYDYMENGSLDKYLHDGRMPTLPWHDRYRVIKGVAASLLYLHEDWEQVVIHRDVKPSNVLLDGEMNARLGDFGLARLYDRGIDPQTTHVVGTIGYVAPELIRTGKATPFTDVFAFGVFVLEVVCARRPIGPQLVSIVDCVIEHHHNGAIIQVVDPRLLVAGEYQTEEVTLALKLGLMCTHPLPNLRPSMRSVMHYLDSGQLVPDPSPSFMSYSMMAMMHNQGFDAFIKSSNLSSASIGASSCVTILSEGR